LKLASHLHKSLDEIKSQTASDQLPLWFEFLEKEEDKKWKQREKWEWYAAQIAMQLERLALIVNGSGMDGTFRSQQIMRANQLKTKDFLLTFKNEQGLTDEEKKRQRAEHIRNVKAVWASMLGMDVREVLGEGG